MYSNLRAQRLSHADLEGEEESRGRFLRSLAQTLADQAAPSFADSNGADAPVLFGQGCRGSTSKEWRKLGWGAASSKELDQSSSVFKDLIPVRWAKGLLEV